MTAPTKADTANEVVAWYAMPVDEVVKTLATGIQKGLSATEASSRLEKCGPNRLPEGKKRGPFVRFISQFNNILVFVLLGAGFIKLMLNLWVDASIIFGVVVLNALLGFVQEGKAERALDSIRNMLSAEARTIRDGDTRMISAEELVPGDVVLLEFGRQSTGRFASGRRQKLSNGRGGPYWRVGAGRKKYRRGLGKRDGWRS